MIVRFNNLLQFNNCLTAKKVDIQKMYKIKETILKTILHNINNVVIRGQRWKSGR
ncbi:hypothetical protein UT300007_27020 [Clostridium sp. CTA-7]